MRILQINTTVNSGSTGRIAEDLGNTLMAKGHQSTIAFGRGDRPSKSRLIRIGSQRDVLLHVAKTALLDRHGFGSRKATHDLLKRIEEVRPQVIHLHNIHGYYLNIDVLFNFLRLSKIPTVWTLHDSWAYTGHCTFYESVMCEKWMTECKTCPKSRFYPASYAFDQSTKNFRDKKMLYADLDNLFLVTPSRWLAGQANRSFLSSRFLQVIQNGIDLEAFYPSDVVPERIKHVHEKIVLGVASTWDKRKGLDEFLKLNTLLGADYKIVLIGLNKEQIGMLPKSMIGIERTENIEVLAQFYSAAEVFVNPTFQDNFPTTNLEALACGTPVITYNTGGSPEAIDDETGFVVEKGDLTGLSQRIQAVIKRGAGFYQTSCRKRAVERFNKNDRYVDYINLYENLIARKS